MQRKTGAIRRGDSFLVAAVALVAFGVYLKTLFPASAVEGFRQVSMRRQRTGHAASTRLPALRPRVVLLRSDSVRHPGLAHQRNVSVLRHGPPAVCVLVLRRLVSAAQFGGRGPFIGIRLRPLAVCGSRGGVCADRSAHGGPSLVRGPLGSHAARARSVSDGRDIRAESWEPSNSRAMAPALSRLFC